MKRVGVCGPSVLFCLFICLVFPLPIANSSQEQVVRLPEVAAVASVSSDLRGFQQLSCILKF